MRKLQSLEEELIADPSSVVARPHFEFLYCVFRDAAELPRVCLKALGLVSTGLELLRRELDRQFDRQTEFWAKALLFLAFFGLAEAQVRKKEKRDMVSKALPKPKEEGQDCVAQLVSLQARTLAHLGQVLEQLVRRGDQLAEDG
jgi:hypothetical protein